MGKIRFYQFIWIAARLIILNEQKSELLCQALIWVISISILHFKKKREISPKLKLFWEERNRVLATNSNFIIHTSLPPDGLNLCHFKLRPWSNRIHSLKYQGFAEIKGLENLNLRQKTQSLFSDLSSFIVEFSKKNKINSDPFIA